MLLNRSPTSSESLVPMSCLVGAWEAFHSSSAVLFTCVAVAWQRAEVGTGAPNLQRKSRKKSMQGSRKKDHLMV